MFRYSLAFLLLAFLAHESDAFQSPRVVSNLKPLESSTTAEGMIEYQTVPGLLDVPVDQMVVPETATAAEIASELDLSKVSNLYTLASEIAPASKIALTSASIATLAPELDLSKVSNLNTPAEAYQALVAKGVYNAEASVPKTLFSAILGGCYVGMGAMLSLAVAGNSPGIYEADPGLHKFIFGALFPVNLLLALQCGGQLYTGNTANMMAAVCEGKALWSDLARSWGLSWMGNFIGCTGFALACKYAGVLEGGAGHLAAMTLATKTSYELGPLFVKAMFCNWLVCLAVFLSMQAKDMGGKYLSIWLPVSTFVSIGFEHSVANMFLLPAGLLSTNDISIETALFHNLIPVTVGNALAGSLFVGAAMSYMFGKLGEEAVEEVQ